MTEDERQKHEMKKKGSKKRGVGTWNDSIFLMTKNACVFATSIKNIVSCVVNVPLPISPLYKGDLRAFLFILGRGQASKASDYDPPIGVNGQVRKKVSFQSNIIN